MARIRSIHPGIYTDEAFMELSMAARVLLPGLWIHADDRGAFEWKPKTLKAQIFPGDNVDLAPLLAELAEHDLVREYEIDGKRYGVIRNFRRWQRPQKPKYSHPITGWVEEYVGLKTAGGVEVSDTGDGSVDDQSDTSTVPVRDQSSTGTGKSFQREDVGGRREEVGGRDNPDRPSLVDRLGRAERAPPAQNDNPEICVSSADKGGVGYVGSQDTNEGHPAAKKTAKAGTSDARGTRLPADFEVPADWIEDAAARRQAHQLPPIDLDLEAEKFCAYWRSSPGKRGVKLDWRAAFRVWTLKAGNHGTGNRYQGRASALDASLRGLAAMAQGPSGDSRTAALAPTDAGDF